MKKLNEMKETFTINHANNTIEMTKQFAKASGVYGSDAYKMLLKAKKQLPTYTVIVKETPKNKQPRDNYKGLTLSLIHIFVLCVLWSDYYSVLVLYWVNLKKYSYGGS